MEHLDNKVASNSEALIKHLQKTDNDNVRCTILPDFLRIRKKLNTPFFVYFLNKIIEDGVMVTLKASNSKNPNGELKNSVAIVKDGVAIFNDLRFYGKSGRGRKFNVIITAHAEVPLVATYHNAIKVTVDGPRPHRITKHKYKKKKKYQCVFKKSTDFEKNNYRIYNVFTELAYGYLTYYLNLFHIKIQDNELMNFLINLIIININNSNLNVHFSARFNLFYRGIFYYLIHKESQN